MSLRCHLVDVIVRVCVVRVFCKELCLQGRKASIASLFASSSNSIEQLVFAT